MFISDFAQILYTIAHDDEMLMIFQNSWNTEPLTKILAATGFDIPSDRDLVLLHTCIPSLFTQEVKFYDDEPINLKGIVIN